MTALRLDILTVRQLDALTASLARLGHLGSGTTNTEAVRAAEDAGRPAARRSLRLDR